jgi:lysophospholipase L1-like esterase
MFWYEDEVKQLENKVEKLTASAETLFYGSSSIRQWAGLEQEFADWKAINLGFGGSTLAACTWFFDRIMKGYQPKRLIVYAGDNDLGDGRHPEEIFIFFQQLAARAAANFNNIHCYYISLKPSPSRWHLADQFRFTNTIIEHAIAEHLSNWTFIDVFNEMLSADSHPQNNYFLNDGLHLSDAGYQVWARIIKQKLQAEV